MQTTWSHSSTTFSSVRLHYGIFGLLRIFFRLSRWYESWYSKFIFHGQTPWRSYLCSDQVAAPGCSHCWSATCLPPWLTVKNWRHIIISCCCHLDPDSIGDSAPRALAAPRSRGSEVHLQPRQSSSPSNPLWTALDTEWPPWASAAPDYHRSRTPWATGTSK